MLVLTALLFIATIISGGLVGIDAAGGLEGLDLAPWAAFGSAHQVFPDLVL